MATAQSAGAAIYYETSGEGLALDEFLGEQVG